MRVIEEVVCIPTYIHQIWTSIMNLVLVSKMKLDENKHCHFRFHQLNKFIID